MCNINSNVRKWHFDLHRHDAGTSAGGSVEAAGSSGGEEAGASGVNAAGAGQNAQTNGQTISPPAQGILSFDQMIKSNPDYEKALAHRIQTAINGRFKRANAAEERLKSAQKLLEKMGAKYGILPGEDGQYDLDALGKAADEDDSYYEKEAFDRGISVADLKHIKDLEAQNAAFRQAEKDAQRRIGEQQFLAKLTSSANECKATYPDFDLDTEMQNETFQRLVLGAGVPVKTAYEVVHHDRILPAAMQFVAQKTAAQTAQTIAAGKARPNEIGAASATAVDSRFDPANLTPQQRRQIREQVMRGDKLSF